MKKNLTKNEKGITLVALIITIIILLILAVVSIREITGDNILGKSETAKEKYESAKNNELNVLKDYSNGIELNTNAEQKNDYSKWTFYKYTDNGTIYGMIGFNEDLSAGLFYEGKIFNFEILSTNEDSIKINIIGAADPEAEIIKNSDGTLEFGEVIWEKASYNEIKDILDNNL